MIITHNKIESQYCLETMEKLDIVLFDANHIGISHCCRFMDDLSDIITIDDLYNMSHDKFMTYLINAYKHIPENHNNFIPDYHICKTRKKLCTYGTKILKSIGICISRDCNLNCPMCFEKIRKVKFGNTEKYKILYFHILNKIKGIPDIGIRLTGIGEPFFYKKETFDYLENLTKQDCQYIEAISNITLLNEEDIKKLYNISKNIPIYISVSCSAITKDTYKKVHGADFFDKVINNIKLLYKYNLLLGINFVIQRANLHELEFYKEFWYRQGINNIIFDTNIIGGHNEENYIVTSKEYINYRKNNPYILVNTPWGKHTY